MAPPTAQRKVSVSFTNWMLGGNLIAVDKNGSKILVDGTKVHKKSSPAAKPEAKKADKKVSEPKAETKRDEEKPKEKEKPKSILKEPKPDGEEAEEVTVEVKRICGCCGKSMRRKETEKYVCSKHRGEKKEEAKSEEKAKKDEKKEEDPKKEEAKKDEKPKEDLVAVLAKADMKAAEKKEEEKAKEEEKKEEAKKDDKPKNGNGKNGYEWTDEKDKLLLEMHNEHKPWPEIQKEFKTNRKNCEERIKALQKKDESKDDAAKKAEEAGRKAYNDAMDAAFHDLVPKTDTNIGFGKSMAEDLKGVFSGEFGGDNQNPGVKSSWETATPAKESWETNTEEKKEEEKASGGGWNSDNIHVTKAEEKKEEEKKGEPVVDRANRYLTIGKNKTPKAAVTTPGAVNTYAEDESKKGEWDSTAPVVPATTDAKTGDSWDSTKPGEKTSTGGGWNDDNAHVTKDDSKSGGDSSQDTNVDKGKENEGNKESSTWDSNTENKQDGGEAAAAGNGGGWETSAPVKESWGDGEKKGEEKKVEENWGGDGASDQKPSGGGWNDDNIHVPAKDTNSNSGEANTSMPGGWDSSTTNNNTLTEQNNSSGWDSTPAQNNSSNSGEWDSTPAVENNSNEQNNSSGWDNKPAQNEPSNTGWDSTPATNNASNEQNSSSNNGGWNNNNTSNEQNVSNNQNNSSWNDTPAQTQTNSNGGEWNNNSPANNSNSNNWNTWNNDNAHASNSNNQSNDTWNNTPAQNSNNNSPQNQKQDTSNGKSEVTGPMTVSGFTVKQGENGSWILIPVDNKQQVSTPPTNNTQVQQTPTSPWHGPFNPVPQTQQVWIAQPTSKPQSQEPDPPIVRGAGGYWVENTLFNQVRSNIAVQNSPAPAPVVAPIQHGPPPTPALSTPMPGSFPSPIGTAAWISHPSPKPVPQPVSAPSPAQNVAQSGPQKTVPPSPMGPHAHLPWPYRNITPSTPAPPPPPAAQPEPEPKRQEQGQWVGPSNGSNIWVKPQETPKPSDEPTWIAAGAQNPHWTAPAKPLPIPVASTWPGAAVPVVQAQSQPQPQPVQVNNGGFRSSSGGGGDLWSSHPAYSRTQAVPTTPVEVKPAPAPVIEKQQQPLTSAFGNVNPSGYTYHTPGAFPTSPGSGLSRNRNSGWLRSTVPSVPLKAANVWEPSTSQLKQTAPWTNSSPISFHRATNIWDNTPITPIPNSTQISNKKGKLKADSQWTEHECEILEYLMSRHKEVVWEFISERFGKLAGRVVSPGAVERKIRGFGLLV